MNEEPPNYEECEEGDQTPDLMNIAELTQLIKLVNSKIDRLDGVYKDRFYLINNQEDDLRRKIRELDVGDVRRELKKVKDEHNITIDQFNEYTRTLNNRLYVCGIIILSLFFPLYLNIVYVLKR